MTTARWWWCGCRWRLAGHWMACAIEYSAVQATIYYSRTASKTRVEGPSIHAAIPGLLLVTVARLLMLVAWLARARKTRRPAARFFAFLPTPGQPLLSSDRPSSHLRNRTAPLLPPSSTNSWTRTNSFLPKLGEPTRWAPPPCCHPRGTPAKRGGSEYSVCSTRFPTSALPPIARWEWA